jgi:2-amino-4-hydroxy-6-hydroxymethyldihydropteridine diphosphokinase
LPELAFIALGSNLQAEVNLPRAVRRLTEIGTLRAVSMVYQNPAIGPSPAPAFLNAAALVETELAPEDIRLRLRRIEKDLGRVRSDDKYAPRVIDLDLSLFGSRIIKTAELSLPDPDILTRPHLAVPLAELAPDFTHPVTGELLAEIADRLRVGADLRPRPEVARELLPPGPEAAR